MRTDHLPESPGCYLYKDDKGDIIYIGKAINIRKRVKSYFSKEQDPKTTALISHAMRVDFVVTRNELEAFLLENNLIKQHQPKYNIDLKDSKRYAHLSITKEPYPRLLIARDRQGELFGPFVSAEERDYVRDIVIRTFRIRTCKTLPKHVCLRYHLGLCTGPCEGKVTKEEYLQQMEGARKVLHGKTEELLHNLERNMKEASKREEFEKAIESRNTIQALTTLAERQTVERNKRYDEHIINYAIKDGTVYLVVFLVKRGILAEKREYSFAFHDDFLEEFIVQYYGESEPPRELIIPEAVGSGVAEYLSKKRGGNVSITIPSHGDKYELLTLAQKNLEAAFFAADDKMADLMAALHLPDMPRDIECFDISHLSGTAMVGSMVRFHNGITDKQNYRRFKIKTIDKVDDYAAIAEIVGRRYRRLKNEGQKMPDLVIIDGGKGQLRAALDAMTRIGVKLPVISLAKREEEVFVPGMSMALPIPKGRALRFLQEIRDEAHRFAIAYHHTLRKKEVRK